MAPVHCNQVSLLQQEFEAIIGYERPKAFEPVRSSTPIPSDKICICNLPSGGDGSLVVLCEGCTRFYHLDCVNDDEQHVKKRRFRCPRCQNNSRLRIPSLLLQSVSRMGTI